MENTKQSTRPQQEPKPATKSGQQPGQPGDKAAMSQQVRSEEMIVYQGVETLSNTLDSLKKLLAQM